MGIIKSDICVTLVGRKYFADIRLGIYAKGQAPAIILLAAGADPEDPYGGDVLATASTNVEPTWLLGFPEGCVVAKNYSENEGLWEQLSTLKDDEGESLFLPTGRKVMLSPWVTAEVFQLSGEAMRMYKQLKGETCGH